ncbi:MAG: Transposase [candidate division TM6 bacterium GW2011_GWF2_37_49]|nr:MAG: Transposase [candidate division TM6 bacterium GW2011_GWF2_37_49]
MKWKKIESLSENQFRRIVGVKRTTFSKMLEIVTKAYTTKKEAARGPGGRPPKLSIEDRIKKTAKIICTNVAIGKRHDFRFLKESGVRVLEKIKILADSGYQGLQKIHTNTSMPKKKSKKQPLTLEDKNQNHEISSLRVLN